MLIVTCLVSLTARAQLIDDFGATIPNDLADYTETVVNSGVSTIVAPTFSINANTNALQVAGNTNQVEQTVFLRSDYSLSVGGTLTASVLSNATGVTGTHDFGIMVAAQANPLGATGISDVRSNLVSVELKPDVNQVGANFFDGHTLVYSSRAAPSGTYMAITSLWISEPSAGVFSVGYNEGATSYTFQTFAMNNGSAGDSSIGNAIGFWGDVRGVNASPILLSDLTIVPEPSTFALIGAGLGFGAMLLRRKRNRA